MTLAIMRREALFLAIVPKSDSYSAINVASIHAKVTANTIPSVVSDKSTYTNQTLLIRAKVNICCGRASDGFLDAIKTLMSMT